MNPSEIDKRINDEVTRQVNAQMATFMDFFGDKYLHSRESIYLDGRNFQFGRANGSSLGTATDQKVGFHGSTAVQSAHINNPSGGLTVDSSARDKINSMLLVLEGKGLTASS